METYMKQLVLSFALTSMLLIPSLSQARYSVPNTSSPRLNGKNEKVERGIASWYGMERQGRRTASGDVYDMNKLTAAHPDLPFGSMVLVTNLKNRKFAVVRVNDRGPGVRGRIIDLSREAARELGFEKAGLAEVSVRVVGSSNYSGPSDPEAPASASIAPHPSREQVLHKVPFTQQKVRIPSASSISQVSAKEITDAQISLPLPEPNPAPLVSDPRATEFDFQMRVERKLAGAVLFLFHRVSPSPEYAWH